MSTLDGWVPRRIDATGPNAGFYERAIGVEICDYFRRVLEDALVGSGKVRFFGQTDYVGGHADEHALRSRLTGETTTVRVRQKVVDATYLETSVPATHTPAFTIGEDVELIPVGELVRVAEPPSGFTVLGAGKTAMDACGFLLDNGVDPDKIRWVRPRDAWLMNRSSWQPPRSSRLDRREPVARTPVPCRGRQPRRPLPPARGERRAPSPRSCPRADNVPRCDRQPG